MTNSKDIEPKSKSNLEIVSETIKSGDLYFYKNGGFVEIVKVFQEDDEIYLTYFDIDYEKERRTSWSDFQKYHVKVDRELNLTNSQLIKKYNKDVIKAIEDPTFLDIDTTADEKTTALIPTEGIDKYEQMIHVLETRKKRVEIIRVLAKEKLDALLTIRNKLQKQLSRVMRVVAILELYLGVGEEVFQLTEGTPAPENHPICIRQLILFMDEEAAIAEIYNSNAGVTIKEDIDWMNVSSFDEWLLTDEENLKQVIPEEKGIVALKASRQDRARYGYGYEAAMHKEKNAMVYLLVRNGENLYRIWINDTMGNHLFPTLSESEDIAKLFEEAEHEWDTEKAEKHKISTVRNALLLQGIIDRTNILRPYPGSINFTDPATYDGKLINLIRDGEALLPDGRPSFNEWKDEMNQEITRGTRIFNAGFPFDRDGYPGRFGGNYYKWFPPVPGPGIYSVDSLVKISNFWHTDTEGLKVLYNPKDTIYPRNYILDPHERTKRISFLFYRSDNFILNYDLVDVQNIHFYLQSRIERVNYLKLMPVLRQILILRKEESEQEKLFINLVADDLDCDSDIVNDAVKWWKEKVIFKRPLDQDDQKAWRMIKQRIKRKK